MLYELGRFFLLSIHQKITKTLQGALFLSTGAENHRSSGEFSTNLVQVDDGAVKFVPLQVESPHTDFAEVTRMVLVKVDTMVVLTTGITTTTRMLTAGKTMSEREYRISLDVHF